MFILASVISDKCYFWKKNVQGNDFRENVFVRGVRVPTMGLEKIVLNKQNGGNFSEALPRTQILLNSEVY